LECRPPSNRAGCVRETKESPRLTFVSRTRLGLTIQQDMKQLSTSLESMYRRHLGNVLSKRCQSLNKLPSCTDVLTAQIAGAQQLRRTQKQRQGQPSRHIHCMSTGHHVGRAISRPSRFFDRFLGCAETEFVIFRQVSIGGMPSARSPGYALIGSAGYAVSQCAGRIMASASPDPHIPWMAPEIHAPAEYL
jgi:hypothetical protein